MEILSRFEGKIYHNQLWLWFRQYLVNQADFGISISSRLCAWWDIYQPSSEFEELVLFLCHGFPQEHEGTIFYYEGSDFVFNLPCNFQLIQSKYNRSYRPVFKSGDEGDWERIQGDVQLVMR